MRYCILALMLILLPSVAAAQTDAPRQGMSTAFGVMALTNSTKQGGQGTEGSTVLTQWDATWHFDWYAAGIFVQYDKQGDSETDFAAGPRLELTYNPFYFGIGYMLTMSRNFTDRAIAKQTGGGNFVELGVRSQLDPMFFIQSSYKYRTQTIKSQDDEDLSEPITQVDGYPLFGLGMQF